jgi:hypothetical protein
MRIGVVIGIIAAIFLLAAPAQAEEVTLAGKMMCGKCTLKAEGLEKCQDVVVSTAADGSRSVYWLVKNDVADAAGHMCRGEKAVTVTGSVAERDGKHWLTASKIDVAASE